MTNYVCVNGSSWFDVVLNTYGTVDQYIKLLNDNEQVPEVPPKAGQVIVWDETIVQDSIQATLISNNGIKYATAQGFNIPALPNPEPVMNYNATQPQLQYTASAVETSVTLTQLQQAGAAVTDVTLEIHPLLASQYSVNYTTGVISLLGGLQMQPGQTLYIGWTIPKQTT